MDDDFSQEFNFGSGSEFENWSERDWLNYVEASNAEILKVYNFYRNSRKDARFEDVASQVGWEISENGWTNKIQENSSDPLSLINHPLYIITRAILKVLCDSLENIIFTNESLDVKTVWHLASELNEISTLSILAVDSTDFGEDMLARSHYKSSSFKLNNLLAKIDAIEVSQAEQEASKQLAILAIFDLRQICLNLSAF